MKIKDVLLLGSTILSLSLAFALGIGFDSYAVSEEYMTVNCKQGANVRSGPGVEKQVQDCLPQGTEVMVVGEKDGWCSVEYDGGAGYIRKDLLTQVPSTVSMEGGEIPMEVNCKMGVNVRSGPGTDKAILGDLEKGTVIIVTGIENNWCKFDYKGKTGYVYGEWLSETDKEATDLDADTEGSGKKHGEKTMIVNCNKGVNIRSDADINSAILGTLEKGTKVKVTDEKNGWQRVNYDGQIGYVYQEWLSEVK